MSGPISYIQTTRKLSTSKENCTMKKLMTLMLGMALAFMVVAPSFGADTPTKATKAKSTKSKSTKAKKTAA